MSGYRIVGDWGTSRLRLFRIVDGAVTGSFEGSGIAALARSPECLLRDAITPWARDGAPVSITLCGMVGSRNGWIEVPYADCPADVASWRSHSAHVPFDGGAVAIMAGLAGAAPSGAPDVMRGEETQLFGALALDPQLAQGRHLAALPGTHSKWAWVEDGRIVAFQTFPTGELFALLRDHSILTRAVSSGGAIASADDEKEGFSHGLARAGEGRLLGALFEARSAQLRLDRSAEWALGYLSGLLLGREVAEATMSGRADRVLLIGDPRLTARYCAALQTHDILGEQIDGDACAIAGLVLAETDG